MKGFYFFNKRKYLENHLMNMLLASWEITVACNLPGMVRKKQNKNWLFSQTQDTSQCPPSFRVKHTPCVYFISLRLSGWMYMNWKHKGQYHCLSYQTLENVFWVSGMSRVITVWSIDYEDLMWSIWKLVLLSGKKLLRLKCIFLYKCQCSRWLKSSIWFMV